MFGLPPDEIRDWLTLILGSIAFLVGLVQYMNAQKWKQLEWIASEVKEFHRDPHVAIALQILDWEERCLPLLLEAPEVPEKKTFIYREEMLDHALSCETRPQKGEYTDEEIVIRDCMDRLLDGLDRFEVFIQANLISGEKLYPFLGYWIDILGDPTNPRKSPEAREWIRTYISDYGFNNVEKLLGRFKAKWQQ